MEAERRARRVGRADGGGRRLRHRAVRHPRDGHGARGSGPVHDRCRLHRGQPRVDRRAEILAAGDGPGLGGAISTSRATSSAAARSNARSAKARRGSSMGFEVDWAGMERLFADVGLPPQIPAMAVRGSLPVMHGRQAGRLRVDQHLVAGAEEIHRARPPAAPVLRAGHARSRWKSRSSTSACRRRARW